MWRFSKSVPHTRAVIRMRRNPPADGGAERIRIPTASARNIWKPAPLRRADFNSHPLRSAPLRSAPLRRTDFNSHPLSSASEAVVTAPHAKIWIFDTSNVYDTINICVINTFFYLFLKHVHTFLKISLYTNVFTIKISKNLIQGRGLNKFLKKVNF